MVNNKERTACVVSIFPSVKLAMRLERLLAGSITIWEDLTTRESLSKAWTRFKDLLQKVPRLGIDLWLQVQIFYDHVNPVTKRTIDQSAGVVPTTLSTAWKIPNKPLLIMRPRVSTKREVGPYTPTIVTTPAVPATEDSPAVPEQTTVETVMNMTPENRAHFESEKEAIHLILTGIGDEIYSTVDACQTAQEMWEAIERLQQGESLNIQDVKTNLFWEFGQFTSHDGETIESYYTRFYKMMNEMIRNNLTVATMQVNVQFLQQLQPEWSRFVTIVKQQHNRIVSDKGNDQGLENQSNISGDESSRSRNKCNDKSTSRDDTDIRPSYDTEPMVKWKKGDSNVIPDSPNMCDNDIQNDQNVVECDDELI
ncbi:hypothetical protein Tco_1540103 [Tanacetum coccineum]